MSTPTDSSRPAPEFDDLSSWLRQLGSQHETRALVCHLLVGLRERYGATFSALAVDPASGVSLEPEREVTRHAEQGLTGATLRAYFPLDETPPSQAGATTVETSTVRYGRSGARNFWLRHEDLLELHLLAGNQSVGTTADGTTLILLQSAESKGCLLLGPRPDRQPRDPEQHRELELIGLHVGALLDRSQLREALDRDPLTGVLSHRAIFATLRRELTQAVDADRPVTIGILELDRLGDIHRTMGHPAGERLARAVSEALGNMLRPGDHLGRYGGQEFLLVLPDTPLQRASTLVQSICEQIRRVRVDVGTEQPLSTTLSVGLLALEYGGTTSVAKSKLEDLVAVADFALLQAKQRGGDTIHKWSWRHTDPLGASN